jgi:hypothetical protein
MRKFVEKYRKELGRGAAFVGFAALAGGVSWVLGFDPAFGSVLGLGAALGVLGRTHGSGVDVAAMESGFAGPAPFIRYPDGKYVRPNDNGLNNADFRWVASILLPHYGTLRPLVADLDRDNWQTLDPESDLADAVLESVAGLIDAVPDWAEEGQLPLVALYLSELERLLRDTIGLDFVHPEDMRPAPKPRQMN